MILCNKGLFIRGVRKNLDKIIPLLFFPQNDRAVSTPFSFFTQSSKNELLGKGLKGAVATVAATATSMHTCTAIATMRSSY